MEILDVDDFGRGLGYIEGKVCFVNKALPKEVVDIKINKNEKNYVEGKVLEVIKESKERKNSFCPFSSSCDGCSFDITSYEYGLSLKKEAIEKMFSHVNISLPFFEIEKNPKSLGYRNKISLKVVDGKVGYYEENSHHFIPILFCPLALSCINNVIKDFDLFSFNNGELIIRGNYNDELLIIINSKDEIRIDKELYNKHKVVGVIVNGKCIYGDSFFYERRLNLLYKVSYDAFFQVNEFISEKIADEIMNNISSDDVVLDLYCGVGFFSLKMALKAKEVIGIEVVSNAVLNALANKELNHIDNVNFLLGRVEEKIDKIGKSFSKVLVDPPRSGLDKKTINFLLASEIPTIIYVSCNHQTLKRDLIKLSSKYKIVFAKGYDMFSYTKHVECLCVLSLK